MIDIDLNNPIDEVRANIGDTSSEFVTNVTIQSALDKFSGDVNKASVLVMGWMLTAFSTLADREREGQVEVYYTNLFERYKQRLDDLKKSFGYKKAVPIYIGGVSLKEKNKNVESLDSLSMYELPDWHSIQIGNKTLVELTLQRLII